MGFVEAVFFFKEEVFFAEEGFVFAEFGAQEAKEGRLVFGFSKFKKNMCVNREVSINIKNGNI